LPAIGGLFNYFLLSKNTIKLNCKLARRLFGGYDRLNLSCSFIAGTIGFACPDALCRGVAGYIATLHLS